MASCSAIQAWPTLVRLRSRIASWTLRGSVSLVMRREAAPWASQERTTLASSQPGTRGIEVDVIGESLEMVRIRIRGVYRNGLVTTLEHMTAPRYWKPGCFAMGICCLEPLSPGKKNVNWYTLIPFMLRNVHCGMPQITNISFDRSK